MVYIGANPNRSQVGVCFYLLILIFMMQSLKCNQLILKGKFSKTIKKITDILLFKFSQAKKKNDPFGLCEFVMGLSPPPPALQA